MKEGRLLFTTATVLPMKAAALIQEPIRLLPIARVRVARIQEAVDLSQGPQEVIKIFARVLQALY